MAEPNRLPTTGSRGSPAASPSGLRRALAATGHLTPAAAVSTLRAEAPTLGGRELLAAAATLHRSLAGTGPLEPLLREPGVTDIVVNGPDQIWVDRGGGLQRSDTRFTGEAELR